MSAREDLEVTLGSDPRLGHDRHAALVGLCRLLAHQIDDAGDRASSRLTASYLSALKDLGRVTADGRKVEDQGGKLGRLKSVPKPA